MPSLETTPSGMSMLLFARIKCSCVSLEAPTTPSNGRILRRCSRWTSRPSLLATTITARPHHTVQLWRLWMTVEMWTRCVCRQDVLGPCLRYTGGRRRASAPRRPFRRRGTVSGRRPVTRWSCGSPSCQVSIAPGARRPSDDTASGGPSGARKKRSSRSTDQRKVCDCFGMKLSDLKAKNRTKAVALFPSGRHVSGAPPQPTPPLPRLAGPHRRGAGGGPPCWRPGSPAAGWRARSARAMCIASCSEHVLGAPNEPGPVG